MSEKVIKWLIADSIFAVALTVLIIFIGRAVACNIENEPLRSVIFYVRTAAWIIADLTILFWFLLYWWSDREWTKIKSRFRRK